MCLACPLYQDRVVANYTKIVELGAVGCHFDGCIGGAARDCWSSEHGHPPGPGNWTAKGYLDVMRRVSEACRRVRPGAVSGTEEPGELAIQHVQMYHSAPGSARTAFPYAWNCQVLKAEPVPLYLSVYHPYQVSLDRWPYLGRDSDYGRHSTALALTWGKQINCHYVRKPLPSPDAPQVKLFREAVRFRALVAPQFLILGDMLAEPEVRCDRVPFKIKRTQPRGKAKGELAWAEPAVRVGGWRSPDERRAYVAVNWTLKQQRFELMVPALGESAKAAIWLRQDGTQRVVAEEVRLPHRVSVSLEPCKAALLEVRTHRAEL